MALNKTTLKQKIEAELTAQGFNLSNEHAESSSLATAIANAVIDEIQQNAQIDTTTLKVS